VDDADAAVESGLIDLSEFSLQELEKLSNPVLQEAVRRVCAEATDPRQVVAGFESSLADAVP